MKYARLVCFASILFASACGDDSPTGPSILPSPASSFVLSGTLEPGASASFPFVVTEPSQVRVTLASLGLNPDGSTVSANMTIEFGTPSGTDCSPQTSTGASPSFTAHIVRSIETAGTYCARVTDLGNLQNTAEVAVRVQVVPFNLLPSLSTAGTDQFTTNLSTGGWMSRTIATSAAGTISLRLVNASPPDGIVLGLGLGVPRTDGTGCLLTQSVRASGGGQPQLSVNADAGIFCARVYDVGAITDPITFTAAIVKP